MWRRIAVSLVVTISLLISGLLLIVGISELSTPEAKLVAEFEGAAREDILGFGFWNMFLFMALFQAIVLGPLLAVGSFGRLVSILALAFILASVVEYAGHSRIEALWVEQNAA